MMLVSPLAGRFITRFGPKPVLMTGLAILVLSYSSGIFFLTEVEHVLVQSAVHGSGVGLAYASLPSLILRSVPVTESAAANGLNTLMRCIGTSMASAVMATILIATSRPFRGTDIPTEAGFDITFGLAALAAAVGVVVAACIPAHPLRAVAPLPVVTATLTGSARCAERLP